MNSYYATHLLSEIFSDEAEVNIRQGNVPLRYIDEQYFYCKPPLKFETDGEL